MLNFAHRTPPVVLLSLASSHKICLTSHLDISQHVGSDTKPRARPWVIMLTTAVASRSATKETKATGVRVVSRGLDLCETTIAAGTVEHSSKQHSKQNRRVQSRISKNGASSGTDETRSSRLTDRDAEND